VCVASLREEEGEMERESNGKSERATLYFWWGGGEKGITLFNGKM
jgi:hypothetical protein